jgi:hypothetical protein
VQRWSGLPLLLPPLLMLLALMVADRATCRHGWLLRWSAQRQQRLQMQPQQPQQPQRQQQQQVAVAAAQGPAVVGCCWRAALASCRCRARTWISTSPCPN